MKRNILNILAFLTLAGIAVLLNKYLNENTPSSLKINEIGFSLSDQIDWIEIYNPTITNISLEGLYLTDNSTDFTKYQIDEEITIPAKGYVVIYCEGYETEDDGIAVTNFRISEGETVYLIDTDGSTIIDTFTTLGGDETEISIGRYPDGGDEAYIMTEFTPGSSNVYEEEDE